MPRHEIALITDSTCDLPDTILREYDIRVVPLMVIWGTEELRDRVDIKPTLRSATPMSHVDDITDPCIGN
jgi:fatty acid-binding protein DegV